MSNDTGWVRYVIGSSSSRREEWLFMPGMQDDPESAMDEIIHGPERWALCAESYSLKVHFGELPPSARIAEQVRATAGSILAMQETLAHLERQLREQRKREAAT